MVLRELGKHPDDQAPIEVCNGRYGPYVRHGKINATLPKDISPDEITLEEALDLIQAKAAKSGKSGKAATTAKKKTTKKAAPAKKTTKAKSSKPATAKKVASKVRKSA